MIAHPPQAADWVWRLAALSHVDAATSCDLLRSLAQRQALAFDTGHDNEVAMNTAELRDAFDAAVIPGMRDRLAGLYGRFRAAETQAFGAHLPSSPDGAEEVYVARSCPLCSAAPPREAILRAHGFDLVECPGCELVYARQVMDDRALAARYHELKFDREAMMLRSSPIYLGLEAARAKYYLSRLQGTDAEVGSFLEVGCGTGTLLLEAGRLGWRSLGIEPELAAAQLARERGASVVTGRFPQDRPAGAGPFGAVAILDVLEHFADPLELLSSIDAHLAPDGRLIIQVPNWDSLLIQIEGAASSVVCPGHRSYFTPATLKALLQKLGYRDLVLETVQSELDRIKAYPASRVAEAVRALRPDLTGPLDLSTTGPLHELELGYKIFGIFVRDGPKA